MATSIKAKIVKPAENGLNLGGSKETITTISLLVKAGKEWREVIDARIYMGRSRSASVVYASIWAFGNGKASISGTGKAGGYGYHKESAALDSAINNAGVELYGDPYAREKPDFKKRCHFGGTGDHAYKNILMAIAKAQGWNTSGAVFLVK